MPCALKMAYASGWQPILIILMPSGPNGVAQSNFFSMSIGPSFIASDDDPLRSGIAIVLAHRAGNAVPLTVLNRRPPRPLVGQRIWPQKNKLHFANTLSVSSRW